MTIKRAVCSALIACACAVAAGAQETTGAQQDAAASAATDAPRVGEPRVGLTEHATAFDIEGREALWGHLRTQSLAGTPDAPARNARLVVENRSQLFYTFVSGWATFYGADGVRCGEGAWKLDALAPGERAEVDTPGLRLTCQPATWRVVASNLLTRTSDVAKPPEGQPAPPPAEAGAGTEAGAGVVAGPAPLPPLELNVNGKTIPVQPGNPLEIVVGKERVRIVLNRAP